MNLSVRASQCKFGANEIHENLIRFTRGQRRELVEYAHFRFGFLHRINLKDDDVHIIGAARLYRLTSFLTAESVATMASLRSAISIPIESFRRF